MSAHHGYEDRFPIVEEFLTQIFPGASVRRLPMNWEASTGTKGHDWDAQLWRAETPERDYDLGITDEALEGFSATELSQALRISTLQAHLNDCSPEERIWIFSGGVLAKAKLGESPTV